MTIVGPHRSTLSPRPVTHLRNFDLFVLAAWCGLAAGELEVVARILYRTFSSTQRLYLMTRHFIWLVPLVNLLLFLTVAALLIVAMKVSPRWTRWLSPRLIIAGALLPVLAVSGRAIYLEAWALVAFAVAYRVTPLLERNPDLWRRRWLLGVPVLLGLVVLQAGSIVATDQIKQWLENRKPAPAAGSPNVLLIVLDTVRADHLSLYGYARSTTPNLERLAHRGTRFDEARATAPWTLASHASMFTGLWPHQLNLEWTSPLRADVPTLAEHLQSLGYATVGFAGNTFYCSYDSGLTRGFTHYEDYVLNGWTAARTLHVINETLKTAGYFGRFLPIPPLTLHHLSDGDRKHASIVNAEFLNWLSRREPKPGRPFFAFLNYIDAHAPYLLPPNVPYRFGRPPRKDADWRLLADDWTQIDKQHIPPAAIALARDAYDNCLSYIDDQLGLLINDLENRGLLKNTVMIVTADHGEDFGEHQLFEHGESLYRSEVRVPLLMLLPPNLTRPPGPVTDFVSLRDLPTTVCNLVHPATRSPFPGRSILETVARTQPPLPTVPPDDVTILSELDTPNPSNPNQGRSPAVRGPLISLAKGDFVYIRNKGDGGEELFNEREDSDERHNLINTSSLQPILQAFRDQLGLLVPSLTNPN